MKYLLFVTISLLFFCGCHKHQDEESPLARQTVLVYMAGDNSLDSYVFSDLREMMIASKSIPDDCHLVVFIDKIGSRPYFITAEKGDTVRRETCSTELRTSSTETLRMALQWTIDHYKAKQYGLVLWGHGDGWIIKSNTAESRQNRAYGQDTDNYTNQNPGTWMNIPDLARVLESFPAPEGRQKPLRFIFGDCCCFQSVESAYELRNTTEYIIGSAAEIPGIGAPYDEMMPLLFSDDADFYRKAIDTYSEQVYLGYNEPMSVVITSEMDNLAAATATVLQNSLQPKSVAGYPDVQGLIYYFEQTLFDMNDFILRISSESDYTEWRRVFDKAVPYSTMAPVWLANFIPYMNPQETLFLDFSVTEERYGGVSMFVPRDPYSVYSSYRQTARSQNETISRMKWYEAAGLDRLGW